MSPNPGKRNADEANLGGAVSHYESNMASRLTKMIRSGVTDLPAAPAEPNLTTWQRFGQNTQYMPLSQVAGADEDDAQAEDVVQGSQDADESSVSSAMLYGLFPYLQFELLVLVEST